MNYISQKQTPKRRYLTALLILAILFLPMSTVTGSASTAFSDVPATAWYSDAVDYVQKQNLFAGTKPGIFDPDIPMTRAMFTQVLANKTTNYDNTIYQFRPFLDTDPVLWFTPAAQWAFEHGITNGTGNFLFSPNKGITREEAMHMLFLYAQISLNDAEILEEPITQTFSDINTVSPFAKESLVWALSHHLLQGTSHTNNGIITYLLEPKRIATRAEIAQLFYNADLLFINTEIKVTPIAISEDSLDYKTFQSLFVSRDLGVSTSNDLFIRFVLPSEYDVQKVLLQFVSQDISLHSKKLFADIFSSYPLNGRIDHSLQLWIELPDTPSSYKLFGSTNYNGDIALTSGRRDVMLEFKE